ncbi:hypothetical protein BKA67DRAFT_665095 [Truncatella angustata]|uniref:C2H2-type domain-containing protein n=1 Tax=Truncatella angustata TaxID=152316 RepID=A0A9P8UBB2_9PEZI|nr:uncharacterized protein BKA67DRAFT_665095 [Truncatella angustata]KAH6643274.1 hypothetical protein BKA67DRAFT_665095 [Truncatella angustata]
MAANQTEQMTAQCNYCKEQFDTALILKHHIRQAHPKCNDCKAKFLTGAKLLPHQRSSGHLHCADCDVNFKSTIQHLLHHHQSHSVATEGAYICGSCGRDYMYERLLTAHCCKCDKPFKTRKTRGYHLKKSSAHRFDEQNREENGDENGHGEPIDMGHGQGRNQKGEEEIGEADGNHMECPECPERFDTARDRFIHFLNHHTFD